MKQKSLAKDVDNGLGQEMVMENYWTPDHLFIKNVQYKRHRCYNKKRYRVKNHLTDLCDSVLYRYIIWKCFALVHLHLEPYIRCRLILREKNDELIIFSAMRSSLVVRCTHNILYRVCFSTSIANSYVIYISTALTFFITMYGEHVPIFCIHRSGLEHFSGKKSILYAVKKK